MEPVIKLARIKTHNCNECAEIFLNEDELEKHSKIHVKQRFPYSLPESAFSNNEDYEFRDVLLHSTREGKSSDPKTLFKCEHCSLKFKTKSTFEAHWARHQQFPYACHCGNVYHLQSNLQTHLSLAHPVKQEKLWEPDTPNVDVESNTNLEYSNARYETQEFKSENDEESNASPLKFEKDDSLLEQNLADILPEKEGSKGEEKKPKQIRRKGANFFMSVNKDGSFSCLKCGIKFQRKRAYRSHYSMQHERRFICQKCDKGFGNQAYLRIHMVTHLDKNDWPYSCSLCDRRFTQVGTAKLHYKRVHARIKNEICQYCNKAFSDRANLLNHERIHTGNKPFECKYCGKRFSDPSAYKRHIRTHTGDKIYACPECPMRFSDASGLIAHKLRHAGIKKYKCDICNKAFLQVNVLKKHVELVHIGIKKFECHYCGKKCSAKNNLICHIQKIHGKELGSNFVPRRFECAYCNKMCSMKGNLVKHIFTMHEKFVGLQKLKFECDYCGEKRKNIFTLRNHIYLVHGKEFGKQPKRVQCHFCNKFYTEQSIRRHINLLHRIQTQYECDYCGEKRKTKKSLEAHIFHKHRKEGGLRKDIFECKQCKKNFSTCETLRSHNRANHRTVIYCNVCGALFLTPKGLEEHKARFCKTKQKVACQLCGESFKYIKSHIKHVHGSAKEKKGID